MVECTCPRGKYWYFKVRDRSGMQILTNTKQTDKALAEKMERAAEKALASEYANEFIDFMNSQKRRKCCTIGDILTAALDEKDQLRKDRKQIRRLVNDLRRVVAYAKNIWTPNRAGLMSGVPIGDPVADAERIDKLPASVLDADLVRNYYLQALGVTSIDWTMPYEDASGIMGTLAHARDIFRANWIEIKYRKLVLPDLREFMTFQSLRQMPSAPQPMNSGEWEIMIKQSDLHRITDPELRFMNVLMRRTGLRPYYVLSAHAGWLIERGGQTFMEIKDRRDEGFIKKRGTSNQLIPLDDEVVELFRIRDRVIPAGSATSKEALQDKHNLWLKRIIGGVGETVQGAYRLRDTVGSALYTIGGLDMAQRALGHTDPKTTQRHYAEHMGAVSDLMKQELSAWLKQPSNVVQMPVAA